MSVTNMIRQALGMAQPSTSGPITVPPGANHVPLQQALPTGLVPITASPGTAWPIYSPPPPPPPVGHWSQQNYQDYGRTALGQAITATGPYSGNLRIANAQHHYGYQALSNQVFATSNPFSGMSATTPMPRVGTIPFYEIPSPPSCRPAPEFMALYYEELDRARYCREVEET